MCGHWKWYFSYRDFRWHYMWLQDAACGRRNYT